MGWNGNGEVVRSNGVNDGDDVWREDAQLASPNLSSSRHDAHDEDLAQAIENTLTKDGQNSATSNLSMGGNRHLDVSDPEQLDQYVTVNKAQSGAYIFAGTTGGENNAFTASFAIPLTTLVNGITITCIADRAPTGASTLNLNGIDEKPIYKNNGATELAADDFVEGQLLLLTYSSKDTGQWLLLNPQVDASNVSGDLVVGGALSLPSLGNANQLIQLDSNNNIVSVNHVTFRTNHLIAQRGTNNDITELNALVSKTWEPVITASDFMTVTNPDVYWEKFTRFGNTIHFQLTIDATLGGALSDTLFVTAPLEGVQHHDNCAFVCAGQNAGVGFSGALRWRYNPNSGFIIFKEGLSNFQAGEVFIQIDGHYYLS